jgi:hypothetical protein
MRWLRPTQNVVLVALEKSETEHVLDHMLTDHLRTRPNPGAATLIPQIVLDSISRPNARQTRLKRLRLVLVPDDCVSDYAPYDRRSSWIGMRPQVISQHVIQ